MKKNCCKYIAVLKPVACFRKYFSENLELFKPYMRETLSFTNRNITGVNKPGNLL